ncbi:hypothetical protein [Plantactinospora sp. GCM10030261]|uniref:hypothetical protein n=1 Tax=Plantactinospora sp. GCM10030261 TaxID=3273420 RepID=UPI003623AA1C
MTRRWTARLIAVLVPIVGLLGLPMAPAGAAPGFDTRLGNLPARFTAGAEPTTLTAVVSTTVGGECRKVRWSLVVRVAGMQLDQVRLDRIEETGRFPTRVSAEGLTARITDEQVDPGSLCRDRTVTARYRLAFAPDVVDARVDLRAEAYDENSRLLSQRSATRMVVRGKAGPSAVPDQTPTPTAEPAPTVAPEDEAVVGTEAPPAAGGTGGGAEQPAGAQSGGLGLVEAGFLVGGLLLFLGMGLLLRMRHVLRAPPAGAADFEPVPPPSRGRGSARRSWQPPGNTLSNRRRSTLQR